jgi:hypothetical protein
LSAGVFRDAPSGVHSSEAADAVGFLPGAPTASPLWQ